MLMVDLFRVFVPWGVLVLLLTEAAVITCCYTLAYYLTADGDVSVSLLLEGGLGRVAVAVFSVLFGLYFVDLYTHIRVRSRVWLLQQISLVIGSAFLFQAFLSYAQRDWILPKWVMIYGSFFTFFWLAALRLFYSGIVLKAVQKQRLLFVGLSPTVLEIAEYLEDHPELGSEVLGWVSDQPPTEEVLASRWLGTRDQLSEAVAQLKPQQIVVEVEDIPANSSFDDLLELRFQGYAIEDVTSTYEKLFGRVLLREFSGSELLFAGRLGPSPLVGKLQLAYSVLIALIGAILTAPLMLLTALAVRLTSPGPILFRQNRVGINGKMFKVLKFRSMYVNVDPRTGPKKGDPRITPLGRWLRLLRLDELPQFFNVMRGDMLIVGPRPEIPEFTKVFVQKIPVYRQRLCVKPGITGWAQINHKPEEALEDTIRKLGFDLYYLKHTSLALDGYIIFNTLKTMLLKRGAR